LNRRIVQPDHRSFAVIELGAIVIVGFDVSVDERVRVIGIGFVEMLRRQSIEDDEARRERDPWDTRSPPVHRTRDCALASRIPRRGVALAFA